MRVLVTGATGFTGSYVVRLLLHKGFGVRCFIRHTSDRSVLPENAVEYFFGDLGDLDALIRANEGVDALVNVASIGFGHAATIVPAAMAAGVDRAIFISTTAIFTTLNARSKIVRMAAEKTIRESALAWTILRPTMIYGSPRDRNMCRLIRYLQKWPTIPVIGSGKNLQQPVYVGDVAQAIVGCLSKEHTIRHAYNIPGRKALSYNQVIETICKLLRRKVSKIYFPVIPVVKTLQAFERNGWPLPIKAEQILRLNEDKLFDWSEAHNDFSYSPCNFDEGIKLELEEMAFD